eukprot:7135194-Lingulodinium_polyedra.AAC.1
MPSGSWLTYPRVAFAPAESTATARIGGRAQAMRQKWIGPEVQQTDLASITSETWAGANARSPACRPAAWATVRRTVPRWVA